MWNKEQQFSPSTDTAPLSPVTSASAGPRAATTIVGSTIRIQGTVTSSEEILLDGELVGELALDQRLTISAKGKVEANIKAREVIIGGSVKGNVEASERITLHAGANLVGDVKTGGIVIEDGAYFKGGIDITRTAAKKG